MWCCEKTIKRCERKANTHTHTRTSMGGSTNGKEGQIIAAAHAIMEKEEEEEKRKPKS